MVAGTIPLHLSSDAMNSPTARHRAVSLALLVIVGAALWISYQGLVARARASGVPSPYLFPVIIDTAGLAFAVIAWSRRADGRRSWAAQVALAVITCWSVWCQVTTVVLDSGADPTAFDRATHAWAPILAVVTFEFLLAGVEPHPEDTASAVDLIDVDGLEEDLRRRVDQAGVIDEPGEWGPETEFAAGPNLPPVLRAVPGQPDTGALEPWLAETIERLHRDEGIRSIDQITGRMLADAKGLRDASSGRKIKIQNTEAIAALLADINDREAVR